MGAALGVNAAAARMRYSRLESRIKTGGVAKSPINTSVGRPPEPLKTAVSKPKVTTTADPKHAKQASNKRKNIRQDKIKSAESSRGGDEQSRDDIEPEEPATKRQTRGVQLNLKETFDTGSELSTAEDTDGSIEEYKESITRTSNDEEDVSDVDHAPKARKKSSEKPNAARNRRSGTSSITHRRVANAGIYNSSLTPPSTSKSTKIAPIISGFDYDEQIKQGFSGLKAGMVLPLGRPSENPVTAQIQFLESPTPQVTMSDIIESIEDDEEAKEEFGVLQAVEEEDVDEESDEDVAEKTAKGPPAPNKSKFFSWLL